MLRILIVEDDSQLATTLKYLVEDNPRYRVVAIAEDADRRDRRGRGASIRIWSCSTCIWPTARPAFRSPSGSTISACRACSSAARRRAFRCPTWRSAA